MRKALHRIVAAMAVICVGAATAAHAEIRGLGPFDIPEWFKTSFLDIDDDAAEAAEEGRHLMVFFHLENCPYCQRMLEDSFVEGTPEAEFIARHFDVVAIDVHGDLEVTAGGESYTEREYASAVGARFTPTIIAYGPDGESIIRVIGYRSPEAFAHVLSYVKDKVYAGEEHLDFNDYVEMRKKVKWAMPDNERFERIEDLSAVGKPLMLVIEDGGCESDCEVLHEHLFPQEDAQEYLDRLVVVRIDAGSDAPIIAPDGSRTTEAELARKIGIKYRPGIAFYQDGERTLIVTGGLGEYHFREAVRYAAGEYRDQFPSWGRYLNSRRQEIVDSGGVVDYTFTH